MTYPNLSQQLKPRIMRRVYGIWFLRRVAPWIGVEILALSVFIFYINMNVALTSVIGNTITHTLANSTFSLVDFVYSAYMYTETTVQLALAGFMVVVFVLSRSCFQGLKGIHIFSAR